MKVRKKLMLVVFMCMASAAKAQFYDSVDDIYYYKEIKYCTESGVYERGNKEDNCEVYVFNFDGEKAAILGATSAVSLIRNNLTKSPSYYEDRVETTLYNLKYSAKTIREFIPLWAASHIPSNVTLYEIGDETYCFSSDRQYLYSTRPDILGRLWLYIYKRVDKSFFKVGRSKTPSGTLHE